MKETNEGQKKKSGEKSIQTALKMATVVASLGASLGVNMNTLLAADLPAADVCGDLTQIQAKQGELLSQVKRLLEQQNVLINQLKRYVESGAPVPLSKVTGIRNTSSDLVTQGKSSNEADTRLVQRFNADKASIADKVSGVESRESMLVNQLKLFWTNQTTLVHLLNNLKVDQSK